MMIPQEKAKELFNKFCFIMPDINDDGSAAVEASKQCALIAVDEIIMCDAIFHANNKETIDERNYWLRVRKAIDEYKL